MFHRLIPGLRKRPAGEKSILQLIGKESVAFRATIHR